VYGRQRVFRSGTSAACTMICLRGEAGSADQKGLVGDRLGEEMALERQRRPSGPGARIGATAMAAPQYHAV